MVGVGRQMKFYPSKKGAGTANICFNHADGGHKKL